MQNMTPAGVEGFYKTPGTLEAVALVLHYRELVEQLDAHVEELVSPIIARLDLRDDFGNPIPDSGRVWLCPDEDACDRYYAACDEAFAAAGYELEPGYWPNLIAQSDLMAAENDLISLAADWFGAPFKPTMPSKLRARLLDLFTNPPRK